MRPLLFSALFFLTSSFCSLAQTSAIGEWRSHLPYRQCTGVAEAGSLIYCSTPNALFILDRQDNSLSFLSKVNGLSDVEISAIKYSSEYKTLVIAYKNANLDLITENGIVNISDIKRKNIFGNKTINRILFIGRYAYLACGFGIVVLDLERMEIHDTYYIGPLGTSLDVMDLAYDGDFFYAATSSGLFMASVTSPNLANYAYWIQDTSLNSPNAAYNNICAFNGYLITSRVVENYARDTLFLNDGSGWRYFYDSLTNDDYHSLTVSQNQLLICGNARVDIINPDLSTEWFVWDYNPGTPQPNAAIKDAEGWTWIADNNRGLVKNKQWDNTFIKPNGPGSTSTFAMTMAGSDLWVAQGTINSALGNTFNNQGPSSLIGGTWYALKDYNPAFDTLWDIVSVRVDPSNYKRVFMATWGHGMIELVDGYFVRDYTYTNSGLQKPYDFYDWVAVSDMIFDENGNLWVLNSDCNALFKVLKTDGTWVSLNVASVASQPKTTQIMIDSYGQKWVILYSSGILVYDDNSTLENPYDDKMKKLTTSLGSGNLPSTMIYAVVEDLDGEIWIGSDKGIAVIYNPGNVLTGSGFDAQVITIEQDSTAQHLLEFETVTSIAVDGGNKKWVGTQKAGVFQFSEDGQEQLQHFTSENSPLLSNTITDIEIDASTGEIYFGTDKGICSYRGYALAGKESFQGVYAYPNPVPPDFDGMIGIKGLTRDSWIKITDISGNLIYETRSEGGQAVWNGKNFSGERAASGVYIVFVISKEGSEKVATKILIQN